ncbi:MAG: succinate--CoA ligase subunit alpha [bacterium]|nr:succinate--CoA ligase subunit alpha [bacterium]
MSILLNKNTKVVVQGITGREGEFHTRQMITYGTKVVAGVTPGKGGTSILDVPVYDTVKEAVLATGATAAAVFVPAWFSADAVFEGIDAGLDLVVCITEGIPTQDMIRVVNALKHSKTKMIGPNCPGIITPEESKIGIIPGNIAKKGNIGVVSRSGTLTYEIVNELTKEGFGQSTCMGIGGDPILGMRFIDILPLFEADPETKAIVLIGEIGGTDEEIAAEYITTMKKPVVSFISGRTAPPGKRMGHAGAIISGGKGTAQAKLAAFAAVNVPIADTTQAIPQLVKKYLTL